MKTTKKQLPRARVMDEYSKDVRFPQGLATRTHHQHALF